MAPIQKQPEPFDAVMSRAIEPYLTAELLAPQAELDMSGKTPFRLQIAVTLHAQNPAICYFKDTFLWPQTALREPGIKFVKQGGDDKPIPRSYVSVCTFGGINRPWNPECCLFLTPGEPVLIDVPFGSLKPAAEQEEGFNLRMCLTTSGLETGCSYEAALPGTTKISWWRWASQDEVKKRVQVKPRTSFAASIGARFWTTNKDDDEDVVPVLPEEQQLPVVVSGDEVVFACVGEPVKWPGDRSN